ncbi:hypothetical protein D3C71_2042690 [compost metagenome]
MFFRLVGVFEPALTKPVVYDPEFSVASPMPWPWIVVALSSSAVEAPLSGLRMTVLSWIR